MVPASIRDNLAGLRRRERLLTLLWGAACWLSIVLVLLFVCGLLDWLIDRQRETPLGVRVGMFLIQLMVAGLAGLLFVLVPQIRRLPDTLLALWVEEKMPQFEHRLISAVQLNQPNAQLDGMSKELVAVVTREAEKQTQRVGGFAQVADHGRLKWTAGVLTPIGIVFLVPFVIWPGIAFTLLGRQLMLPLDVPHSVTLESISQEYWPIGEKIKIHFRVNGEWTEDMEGTLHVTPEGQSSDEYPLTYLTMDKKGAIFEADVNPSSVNIRYSARLVDGRTKFPVEMQLVPRPIITDNMAWTLLPAYCGLRPARTPGMTVDERRYEEPQARGDVVGITGSSVRVRVKVQKEISRAWLELLVNDKFDKKKPDAILDPADEKPTALREMTVLADHQSAELRFDLAEGLTGYRVIVRDKTNVPDPDGAQHGFANIPAPRRSLRLIPEAPPTVMLLRDSFGEGGDFDVEGMPVRLGKKIRIPYACYGSYGLGKAELLYRVLKEHESSDDPVVDDRWSRRPLAEYPASDTEGRFDPKTGVFKGTPFFKAIEFHAMPSDNADRMLGRTVGGGRAFLDTSALRDNKGPLQLKSGDKIEYCVKIYASLREPIEMTPFAISETRVTTVLNDKAFDDWLTQLGEEDKRLRQLEQKQKGVFEPK